MQHFDIEKYKNDLKNVYKGVEINPKSFKSVSHYTSPFGLEGILKSKNIRFTESSVLNDGLEGEMIYKCIDFCIEKIKNELDIDFYEAIRGAILYDKKFSKWLTKIDQFSYSYFIACFCQKKDSLPMWNYYTKTKDSLGYAIVFNFEDLYNNLNSDKLGLPKKITCFKVIYYYRKQQKIITDLLLKVNDYWKKSMTKKSKCQLLNEFNNVIEYLKLCFKNKGFVSEDEVRFVISIENEMLREKIKFNNGNELIKLQYSNGIYKPYIELEFGGSDAIKEIVVSPTIKDSASKSSVNFLLDKYGIEAKITISNIPIMYI